MRILDASSSSSSSSSSNSHFFEEEDANENEDEPDASPTFDRARPRLNPAALLDSPGFTDILPRSDQRSVFPGRAALALAVSGGIAK